MRTLTKMFFVMTIAAVACSGFAQNRAQNNWKSNFITFTGKVVDEHDEPLPNVQVHLLQSRGSMSSHSIKETDANGSFTLHLMKQANGVVFANDSESERVVDYTVVKAPVAPIKLVLKKHGRTLGGMVVDANGKPVPNALIAIAAAIREPLADAGGSFRLGLREAGELHLAADEHGRFKAEDLPALPIILWTAKAGDKKGLSEQLSMSAKRPVIDLKDGNVLDYKAVIDEPADLSPRIREHMKSIQNQLKSAHKNQHQN